jgi:hypothetical protein
MVSKQSKLLRILTTDKLDDILALLCCLFFLYAMYSWMKRHNIFSDGVR